MRHGTVLLATLGLLATPVTAEDLRTAVVAGGCFWCVESDFDKVDGVVETISGYSGGASENPDYKAVSAAGSGHLEVVQITYDADILGYDILVSLFLRSIDPLDDGGQFCDRGEPYTTAIFVKDEDEQAIAQAALAEAEAVLGAPLATTVREAAPFYAAEDGHQDYYKKNPLRYTVYRKGCGRDARVKELWGKDAAFDHGS